MRRNQTSVGHMLDGMPDNKMEKEASGSSLYHNGTNLAKQETNDIIYYGNVRKK